MEKETRKDAKSPQPAEGRVTASKDVIESYIFATARGDNGIYSERLLLRLVELAQREVNNLDFRGGTDIGRVTVSPSLDAEVTIPVKDILSGSEDKNYAAAKAAVKGLMGRFIEYEDNSRYQATSILSDVDLDKVAGKMVIRVNRNIWRAMLDFSKGFRRYDLEVAIKLKSRYGLRIYKLISQQNKPITFSVEDLKKMWGIEGKYKRTDDFIKSTIVPAQEELDRVAPFSFTYTANAARDAERNRGRRGRPVITSITFVPIRKDLNRPLESVLKSVNPKTLLGTEVYDLLVNKLGFDYTGIRANITLLNVANQELELAQLLRDVAPAALRADNPQGYVINSIRKCLKEDAHVVVDEGVVIKDAVRMAGQRRQGGGEASGPDEPKSLKDLLGEKK